MIPDDQRRRSRQSWERHLQTAVSLVTAPRVRLLVIAAMMIFAVALHYGDEAPMLSQAADHSPVDVATRNALERVLFLLPVIYAALTLGARGGIATLAIAAAALYPGAVFGAGFSDHALVEITGVLALGGLLVLAITQQHREIEAQKEMRASLDYFLRQILRAQEDERKRIAQDLHDETAQALLVACQRLDSLASADVSEVSDDVSAELRDLRAAMVHILTDLRGLTQNLRPRILDDLGLVPALEWLADSLSDEHGITAHTEVASDLPSVSRETQLILFRIAQEALRNVGRHSGATEA